MGIMERSRLMIAAHLGIVVVLVGLLLVLVRLLLVVRSGSTWAIFGLRLTSAMLL